MRVEDAMMAAGESAARRRKARMVDQVVAMHREIYGDAFAVIVQDENLVPQILDRLIERRRSRASGLLNVTPVSCSIAPTRSNPVMVRTGRGRKLMFRDGSGGFRIDLGHGEVVHAIRCRLNGKLAREYVAGPETAIRSLYLLLASGRKRARVRLPRRGVWRTYEWECETAYAAWRLNHEAVALFRQHPVYPRLIEDARAFFSDIEFYTRYGQTGMRKVLMTGPPGTGKTSLLIAMAAEMGAGMPVVLADDHHVSDVCAQAAKLQRPCVVVAEELDMLFRPDAAALGFLDGVHTPRNPAGTYLIATTNYPRRIDPRILKRPGRIDLTLPVGALRGRAAGRVAAGLLPEDAPLPERELGQALDRTTPAEIREIIGIAVRMCRPAPGRREAQPLTLETITLARAELKRMIAGAETLADDTPEEREDQHGKWGPIGDFEDELPF